VNNYKLEIHKNILYSIKELIEIAEENQLSLKEENISKTEKLLEVEFESFNEEIGDMIQEVYQDPAIISAMEKNRYDRLCIR